MLTVRSVDALTAKGRDTMFWDRDLPGFGVRVYRSGRKVYIAQARGPTGGTKRAVVGRHGKMQPKVSKKRLHELVDELSESQADAAERYLRSLRNQDDPVIRTMSAAPVDDEALRDEDRNTIDDGHRDIAARCGIPNDLILCKHGV